MRLALTRMSVRSKEANRVRVGQEYKGMKGDPSRGCTSTSWNLTIDLSHSLSITKSLEMKLAAMHSWEGNVRAACLNDNLTFPGTLTTPCLCAIEVVKVENDVFVSSYCQKKLRRSLSSPARILGDEAPVVPVWNLAPKRSGIPY
jgi:hypothetical protein